MKYLFFHSKLNIISRLSILLIISFLALTLIAQNHHGIPFQNKSSFSLKKYQKEETTTDTTLFHSLNVHFQAEVSKRYDINLDSLSFYGNATIQAAIESHYDKGLTEVYLSLGSGYIDKYKIPLAKRSFSLAIEKATAIKDTQLMAKGYAGYGWALVYDNSDYAGSIHNISIACQLAREAKDSSLFIIMATKLARV